MKNIVLLFVCSFALFNPMEIWALKRIKRDTELNPNHHKIKQDFVKLNTGKQDFEKEVKTEKKSHEDSLSDSILKFINANTTNNHQNIHHHSSNFTKKRGINSPVANILGKREHKLNEHHPLSQIIPLNRANGFIGGKTYFPKSKTSKHKNSNTSKDNRIGHVSEILPLATGSANIFGTHVIIPPQPIQPFNSLNSFTPIVQMMKFANMLMFKVGMDSIPPYNTQSNQMAFSPNMLMSLNSHNQQHFRNDDIDPSLEFLINSIDGPQSNSFLMGPANIEQFRTVVYEPPLIFKQPIIANEPKQLIDLIENTLDTVLSKTSGDSAEEEGEIEVHCPIHHGKKSFMAEGNYSSDEIGEQEKYNNSGVIQVCSCRFIKNTKKDVNKAPN